MGWLIFDIPKVQFNVPPPDGAAGRETRRSQSRNVNDPLHIERLDGEVTRLGEFAYSGGEYCEVWVGRWRKGGRQLGREEDYAEKVSLGTTTTTLLTWPFVDCFEGFESTQVTREDP